MGWDSCAKDPRDVAIIMKLLREYIRELLTETAKGPGDLPEGVVVVIKSSGAMTSIYYGQKADPAKLASINANEHAQMGYVDLASNAKVQQGLGAGPCGGASMIVWAEALSGWGPLLYDVAMEYATDEGGGIIADRGEVSREAHRVWNYYMQNRGEVTGIQLDDMQNTLTPEEEDNCDQEISSEWSRFDSDNTTGWPDSSLSKRYTKPPIAINALRSAGKLVVL